MIDQQTFVIIISLTTAVSYIFIRRYFSIAPRYMMYASLGIVLGLFAGTLIAWPLATFLGRFGVVVAPYLLGIVLLFFVEAFIIEGPEIIRSFMTVEKKELDMWEQHRITTAAKRISGQDIQS